MKTTLRFLFKTVWVVALLSITQIVFSQAQTFSFENSWGKQGISLLSENQQALKLNVSLEKYMMNQTTVDRENMNAIAVPGVFLPGETGSPDLPVYSRYIAVPQGATVKVNIVRKRTETNQNVEIAPAHAD